MAKVGLEVSVEKCEAWSPNPNLDFSALPNAITVRSRGLKNLGADISNNDDLIQALFLKRVEKCENLMESYRLLEDPQLELHLLRSCAALPKITFSMRTCDPFSISTCLDQFDNAVHLYLESITGPISSIAPVAFFGYYIDTKYLSHRIFYNTTVPSTVLNCSSSLEFLSDNPDILLMAPRAQMKLSSLLDSKSWSELTSSASTSRDRARLLSCSLPNSGDWLSAVPLKALGLTLR